jgi:site-specific DNA recombinase
MQRERKKPVRITWKDGDANERPVGIWIRVSTEGQALGDSPEHHEHRARAYAESKGWAVVRVYNLAGVSGKTVKEHPEAKAMLDDVAAGRISALIFSKLARLARNTKELLEFSEYFKRHDAALVSLSESIDTSTPAGLLFYTVIAALAEFERGEIADRVKASVKTRAKLGKPLGGAAPFGYRWVDKKLVPDPNEAPIVRRLFELFREHKRLKMVGKILNEAGHRTRGGADFSDTTVGRLLSEPTAKGLRRANYTTSCGANQAWAIKPEEEWIYVPVEAIVSVDLWEECNNILAGRRDGRRPSKTVVHLFTGYTFCECGTKMYVPSNNPKYCCRSCKNKVPLDDLERVFKEQLQGFVFSPEDVQAHLETADEEIAERKSRLDAIVAERDKTKAEADKVYRLYVDGAISPQGFGDRYRPLEERLGQLDLELPRLQGEMDFLTIRHLSSGDIIKQSQDLYGGWDNLTFEEKRQIVETIVERVTVGKDGISFDLNYLPAGAGPRTPPASEAVAVGQRTIRVALPICHLRLSAPKPPPKGYPKAPKTIGQHLRKRRMDLGLTQRAVAEHLGVDPMSVWLWEHDRVLPGRRLFARAVDFLGCHPAAVTHNLPNRFLAVRPVRG